MFLRILLYKYFTYYTIAIFRNIAIQNLHKEIDI